MKHMNNKETQKNNIDVEKFKEKLEEELKIVERELTSIGRINPSNPKDWEAKPEPIDILNADQTEVAEGITEYEGNTGVLKQLEIRFNEIKNALKRIDDGVYGSCEKCEKEIEQKRLEANPAATTCISHIEN